MYSELLARGTERCVTLVCFGKEIYVKVKNYFLSGIFSTSLKNFYYFSLEAAGMNCCKGPTCSIRHLSFPVTCTCKLPLIEPFRKQNEMHVKFFAQRESRRRGLFVLLFLK